MSNSGFKVGCRKVLILSLLTVFCSVNLLPSNMVAAQTNEPSVIEQEIKSSGIDAGIIVGQDQAARENLKTYHQVMREFGNWQKEPINKPEALNGLIDLLLSESERLDKSGVDQKRKAKYLNRLQQQLDQLEGKEKDLNGKIKDIFTKEEDQRDVKILKEGSKFKFNQTEIKVEELEEPVLKPSSGQSIEAELQNLFKVEKAEAAMINPYYPVLADIKEDTEVKISAEIKDLAENLEYNPVKILNYVKNNIDYEPYYGAKKGALGCLLEKSCNDFDGSSLVIALLRAANIPARYQQSLSIIRVEDLQKLLGVDETKTVYLALALNHIPVFTISGNELPESFDEADFSQETHLAVYWTHVEMFYEYDERGANFANTLDLTNITTNEELQTELIKYPKKQWVPIEGMIKKYNHTKKEILADTANFNSENFWQNFFQYQGELSLFNKYQQDLKTATGKEVSDNLSTKSIISSELEIVPIHLPYLKAEADNYPITNFSAIPELARQQVKISLKRETNNEIVLEKSFYGSEINNQELSLSYQGATETDQAIIDSYGGLHLTPVELVKIKAFYTLNEKEETLGTGLIYICEALILSFEYKVKNLDLGKDEKFSTAGNTEGIYLYLSQYLDDDPELQDNRMAVFKGNLGFAQKYLQKIEEEGKILKQSLDYEYTLNFARAVVTQTRILNRFNGVPTTFDFKGFNLDASIFINDWSNRGNYKTHQKDFRLFWGQSASYQEGQMFKEVSGLSAISTVKGLQYAYAHPESYTVKKITQANKSEIDNLDLSDNTKANMKADVDQGNTILTPDKIVDNGTWHGLFYVSLNTHWTGTYAIGEQVIGNGGWTTDEMEEKCASTSVLSISTQNNACYYKNECDEDDHLFLYQDLYGKSLYDSISCFFPDKARFYAIQDTKDDSSMPIEARWNEKYGFPCIEEPSEPNTLIYYGSYQYKYIVASEGAKFYSPGKYNYWVKAENAMSVLERDKNKDNPENLSDIKLDSTFKFSSIARTYLYKGHYGWGPNKYITAYYQPDQSLNNGYRGVGRMVYGGDILDKLQKAYYDGHQSYYCNDWDEDCGKKNWVIHLLGFPIENRKINIKSPIEEWKGYYQRFVGGGIYAETTWLNKTYYVPGEIHEEYYKSEYCTENGCGPVGFFGFPVSDPKFKNDHFTLKQSFEVGHGIVTNTLSGEIGIEHASKYYCDEINGNDAVVVATAFFEGLWDGASKALKTVLIFGGMAMGAGITADFFLGTHGGVEAVGLIIIGGELSKFLYEIVTTNKLDDILDGAESWVKYEFEHSNCTARKIYLLSRYSSSLLAFVVGFKKFDNLFSVSNSLSRGVTIEKDLAGVRNNFVSDVKTLLGTSSNKAVKEFVQIGEKAYYEDVNAVIKKTKTEVDSLDLLAAARRAYQGKAYDEAIELNDLRPLATNKLSSKNLRHIILGDYSNNGYLGGGHHEFSNLNRKIQLGLIQARDPVTKKIVKNLYEIPSDAKGIRVVELNRVGGNWKKQPKSIFPEGLTYQEIRDVILEAGQEKNIVIPFKNKFEAIVNIKGKNITIEGFFRYDIKNDIVYTNIIDTAYPSIKQ